MFDKKSTSRSLATNLRITFANPPAILFSLALTVALIVGRSFFVSNDFSYAFGTGMALRRTIAAAIIYFVVTMIVSSVLMRLLSSDRIRLKDADGPPRAAVSRLFFGEGLRSQWILWAVIFVCWIPCLLAYWPGVFSYDMPNVLPEGDTQPYSDFQPLIYTFFVKAVYALASAGGNQTGALLLSVVQMLLMSLIFAGIVRRLNRMRVHPALRLISLLWFALYPSNAIFAIVEAKDTLFAGFFALVTLSLIELAREPGRFFADRRKLVLFGVQLLLLCLLRNNAAYLLILLILITVLFQRKVWKGYFRKLLAPLCGAVIVFFIFAQALSPALGVKSGPTKEMLSVPAQQIAYTYIRHAAEFTPEERSIITNTMLVDILADFNPRLADPIKNYTRDWPVDPYSKGFMKVWARIGLRYPAEYTKAFLALNLQSWFPGSEFPDRYSQRDYIETFIYPDFHITRTTKAPALMDFYEGIATRAGWQHVPVLSLLFDTGAPLWFALFGIALSVYRKHRRDLLVFLLPVCLWATIMFGPVTNGRYLYPLFVCFPLWLIVLLAARKPLSRPAGEANNSNQPFETSWGNAD